MNGGLDRRMRRLERGTAMGLPWSKPAREWTDEQLLAVIGHSDPSNVLLLELSRPDVLILGVPEKTVAEWVEAYGRHESGGE